MKLKPTRNDTRAYDGHLVDGRRRTWAPGSVQPEKLVAAGNPKDELAVYVNGINTDLERQMCDMRVLTSLGYRVVGVHNATAGVLRDLGQCVADKLGKGENPAVNTVKSLLKTALQSGRSLTLIGHSQGALVCSRALWETRADMMAEGMSAKQVARKMSGLKLHTAGGAAYRFPDGPDYHHRINLLDPVALVAGLMMRMIPGVQAGANATVETFCRLRCPAPPHRCEGSNIKPSALDTAVHGVHVYYGAAS